LRFSELFAELEEEVAAKALAEEEMEAGRCECCSRMRCCCIKPLETVLMAAVAAEDESAAVAAAAAAAAALFSATKSLFGVSLTL